jgi:AraC family transcriptional regulator
MLHQTLDEPAQHSALAVEYLSRGLAADVLANYVLSASEKRTGVGERLTAQQVRRVVDYINQNLSADVSLDNLATAAGLSRTTFIQRFKVSFRKTPHQYLIEARIRKAQDLLTAGNLSLAEIALTCGFADQAHFSARFRAVTGMTPSAFRQHAK